MTPVEATTPVRSVRGLRLLLASTGVSMVGQGAVAAAVPLLAATITRDPLGVSLVAAATYAAWLVVGLPAGALVDRWPRRLTMVTADLVRVALLVALAAAVVFDMLALPALIAVVFLIATAGCFFDPAAQAMIPAVAGRDRGALAKANGGLWTLDVLGRSLLGPPLGAALFAVAAVLPLTLNAVTFLISAVLLAGVPRVSRAGSADPHQHIGRAVVAGVKFLAQHAELRLLTLGMATYNFGYNIAFATLVLFAQERMGLSESGFGVLLATLAVGGIVGGWVAPKVHARVPAAYTYAACLMIQGLAWLVAGVTEDRWATGTVLVVIGLASTVVSVVGGTARQELTPDDLIGRITAGTRVLGIGAAAVGSVVGGTVASATNLTAPMFSAAGLLVACSAAFALAARLRP